MKIDAVEVSALTIPTDRPESDGTATWDSTGVVLVEIRSGGTTGLGWTYAPHAAGKIVEDLLAPVIQGRGVEEKGALWVECGATLRNAGRPGIGFCALSAVDVALWDLHARLLDVPLLELLPACHDRVPVYGSGGFCTYTLEEIATQLGGWVDQGIPRVKMKIGRVAAAREATGEQTELFVDANGAFSAKEAVRWAQRYQEEWGVVWFEEPVSSADFEGLRLVRGAASLDVAAGEYAYVPADFRNLIGAVDCLQADVTRCGGISGILRAAGLAGAYNLDISGHCAPQLSAHALCGVEHLRHLEYFHDHVRVESMLFDGVLEPIDGALIPDAGRPGHGLTLKNLEVARWAA
jgi:L-alanine-DL-glutamate epimerase-like enolase superfamily enzyme